MQESQLIGNNISGYRKRFGLTQDQVAGFIGVDRSTISLYESGDREVPLVTLEKLSDLFSIELHDLVNADPSLMKANMAFAFRAEGDVTSNLQSISSFQRVVKNYLRMKEIAHEDQ